MRPPAPPDTSGELRRIIDSQAEEIRRLRARLDELEGASGTAPAAAADDLWRRLGLDDGERRTVTVLFADVSGFTTLAERLDPEDCTAVMRDTLRTLARVVTDHGGYVEKFIGDAVCALFGAPVAHEDEPQRAARAALDMHRRLEELAASRPHLPPLTVHIGINTGTVIAGEVGDGTQFGVMGDTINTAARLMDAAGSGQTFVAAATASRLRGGFELHDAGVLALKGKQQEVQTFELAGAATAPLAATAEVAFVGRERELDVVMGGATAAGAVFVVTGPAGIGKSRFLREAAARVGDARVLTSSARAHGARPGQLVADLLTPLVRELPDGDLRQVCASFVDDDTLRDVPDDFEAGLAAALRQAAERSPLLLVLDGFDQADGASVSLVPYLVDATQDLPVRWIVGGRSGDPEVDALAAATNELRLPPLSKDETIRLVSATLPGAFDDHPEVAAHLATIAAGTPEYCTELVRALADQGLVVAYEGGWHLVGDVVDLETPETLRELIEARLERLDTMSRRVLQAASVIGVRFSEALLGRAADEPSAVAAALVELEELQFVLPPSPATDGFWSFRTPLLRSVVYDSILRRRRPEYHRRAAEGLLALHPDDGEAMAEALAFHYDAAGEAGPSAEYLALAAERAIRAHAPADAEELLAKAIARAPSEELQRRLEARRDQWRRR